MKFPTGDRLQLIHQFFKVMVILNVLQWTKSCILSNVKLSSMIKYSTKQNFDTPKSKQLKHSAGFYISSINATHGEGRRW